MEATTVSIPGLIVFTPQPHVDRRGLFSRTFDARIARRTGIDPAAFVQDSVSRSAKGVIRGLHVRVGAGENKLVRCSAGAIYDVVVDLRPSSAKRAGRSHEGFVSRVCAAVVANGAPSFSSSLALLSDHLRLLP